MNIGDLFWSLRADGALLQKDVAKEGAKAGATFAGTFSAKTSTLLKAGAVFGFGASGINLLQSAASGAVDALKDSITAASDLNETVSKSGVVFGDSAAKVLAWSKTTATALGLSQNQALAAAGTYGNLFVSMGLAGDKASTMSVRLVQLAGDLASFNNATPEDALAALQSGLVGETEPLRKFGVNLNDAALRQKALELGLTTTTKEVLPAAIRAQAAYALILDQSATAQGDFARTSDGFANQQRIVAAEMANLSATIGAELLPVFLSMERELVKIVPLFVTLVGVLAGPGTQAAGDSVDGLGSKTTLLGQALHGSADALSLMAANLLDLADGGHRVADMFDAWDAAAIKAGMAMTGTADHAGKAADDLVVVGRSFQMVGAQAGDMGAAIAAAGLSAAQSVENMRNRIVAAAMSVINGAYGKITAADQLAGTNAEINAQRRIVAMGGAASGTDKATAALDRQSKALDKASDAEKRHDDASETVFQRTMKRLAGEYGARLDALDLAEQQLALADRQRGLNEQLNQAQLDLAKAQRGGPGGVNAEDVSSAMARVADIQAQQAENERQLTVDTLRARLEATKAYIEDIAKLEADSANKPALAKNLKTREKTLTSQLDVATAAKDAAAIEDITAKLEAVKTAEERTGQAERARAKQDELSKLKAQLDEQRQAMNTSGGASVADAKVRLHELFQTQAEEVLALALAGKLGSKEVTDALADMKLRLTTATGDERVAIEATIKALKDLETQAISTFLQFPSGSVVLRPVGAKGGPQVRDSGPSGSIPHVPSESGIVPSTVPGWMGGAQTIEVPVYLDGDVLTRVVSRRQADAMNR